ncbi:MAG: DUF4352 domain-containing protein [Acidobacteriota bacterium]|nr:DUF4352 domain-containing protein [Acidobacteriota bacterium]
MIQSTLSHTLEAVYVPANAPVAVIALLGAAGVIVLAVIACGIAAAAGRRTVAAWLAGGAGVIALGYGGALLALALASPERVLSAGGKKYFCELDCHVAVSVDRVETSKSLGSPQAPLSASGRFVLARVRTWFDPSTIAPWRGNAPLTPNPRTAWIVDASGRRYPVSPEATRAAALSGLPSEALDRQLRPGESFSTTLVFDVPSNAPHPKLFFGDPPGVEALLLGHENSPFHRKVLFDLGL